MIVAKQPSKGRKTANQTDKTPDQDGMSAESDATAKPTMDAIPPEVHATAAPAPATAPAEKLTDAPKTADSEPEARTVSQPPAPQSSGAGFLPLALGGLLAGVIGGGAALIGAQATLIVFAVMAVLAAIVARGLPEVEDDV